MKMLSEKKSPFAIFTTDEKLFKVENGLAWSLYITPMDKRILEVINDSLITTSALIYRILRKEFQIDQKEIQKRLFKLSKALYVEKYLYKNEDGSYSANKIYALGYRGRGFLKSCGIQARKTYYVQNILNNDPVQVKRLLSSLQFAVQNGDDFIMAEPIVVASPNGDAKYIFRAQTVIQKLERTIILESIRNVPTEVERVVEKIERINTLVKHRKKANIYMSENPKLILIAEDEKHMNFLKRELESKLKKLSYIEIYITNDLDVFSESYTLERIYMRNTCSLINLLVS